MSSRGVSWWLTTAATSRVVPSGAAMAQYGTLWQWSSYGTHHLSNGRAVWLSNSSWSGGSLIRYMWFCDKKSFMINHLELSDWPDILSSFLHDTYPILVGEKWKEVYRDLRSDLYKVETCSSGSYQPCSWQQGGERPLSQKLELPSKSW